MRTPRLGPLAGLVGGLVVAMAVVWLVGELRPPRPVSVDHARAPALHHVPEDASAPLTLVLIHYAPAFDQLANPVWKQLFTVLRAGIQVKVAVATDADWDRFQQLLTSWDTPHRGRFSKVVVGAPLTTWSRDRFAALQGDDGTGDILAPPRAGAVSPGRAGDFASPQALAHALWGRPPRTADFVFEGGDLASTPGRLFVDANLIARNLGRGDPGRDQLVNDLRKHVAQDIVWLGDQPGDVPRHHILMYMAPLDESTVVVGDVRAGLAALASEPAGASLAVDEDSAGHCRRFDHAAELLAASGLRVLRLPAVVLAGAGSYVTYTNAVFDLDDDGRRMVYLPTYHLPSLDAAAIRFYEERGYRVHPIDVSTIYQQNGSIGCLVNIVARAPGGADNVYRSRRSRRDQ